MMDMGQGGMSAGQSPPAPEAGGDMSQGYELCIRVTPDGISVYKGPLDPQAGQGEPQGQPANSIGEALKIAAQLYQQDSGGQEDAAVMSGFNATNPNVARR